jgi:hypothetical protein
MDHTVVHFEIPADDPERAARFYRELFECDINRWAGATAGGAGMEYWLVRTVPSDASGQPTRPGVNGGLMRRLAPGQSPVNYIGVASVDEFVRRAERLGARGLRAEDAAAPDGMVRAAHRHRGDPLRPLARL